jgi:hypothetical protein
VGSGSARSLFTYMFPGFDLVFLNQFSGVGSALPLPHLHVP